VGPTVQPPECQKPKDQYGGGREYNRSAKLTRETTVTRGAEVTGVQQEILLVPRTVYVPYAAQVPVTTLRMGRTDYAGPVVQTNETLATSNGLAAARSQADDALIEALKRELKACQDQLKRLEECKPAVRPSIPDPQSMTLPDLSAPPRLAPPPEQP
jgi:hypothetical protein